MDIDRKSAIGRSFGKAAAQYDDLALFQRQINDRMASLLPTFVPAGFTPGRILDAGCGTGLGIPALKAIWPEARITGCDLSEGMVLEARRKGFEALVCDIENLPFPFGHFDLVWSSLSLQWCHPYRALSEFSRVLSYGGCLFFSTLAPGTLKEVDYAFSGLDTSEHVIQFVDVDRLRGVLSLASFTELELIQETHQVFYPTIRDVMASIKGIGAGHVDQRRNGLLGRKAWERIQARYESLKTDKGLPVTYEVIIASARVNMAK